jgi:protein phosphatase 2C family protein 2/3
MLPTRTKDLLGKTHIIVVTLHRNYNEDRVSIILNILKPPSRSDENWPKCSFFGVYDGHGGSNCADYLRDNLHQFVIREGSFPWNPREALRKGFEKAEKRFLELAENSIASGVVEKSGSCAVVTLIVGDMCYIANVGDSRAVLSGYL